MRFFLFLLSFKIIDVKQKYIRYANKTLSSVSKDKRILIIGATGGLGSSLCNLYYGEGFDLVLAGRNEKSLLSLKESLVSEHGNKADILIIDFEKRESVDLALDQLSSMKIDILINVSGIYHQEKEFIDGHEKMYLVNFLMTAYFLDRFLDGHKDTLVMQCGSVSYNYRKKIDYDDVEGLNIKNKTNRYGMIKREIMQYCVAKRKEGYNIIICHPGVAVTNLFHPKNGAYKKWFYKICVPIMKVIFMSGDKACLSFVLGASVSDIKDNEWIGPRGLFHSYGYPNKQKLKKNILEESNCSKIKEIVTEYRDLK